MRNRSTFNAAYLTIVALMIALLAAGWGVRAFGARTFDGQALRPLDQSHVDPDGHGDRGGETGLDQMRRSGEERFVLVRLIGDFVGRLTQPQAVLGVALKSVLPDRPLKAATWPGERGLEDDASPIPGPKAGPAPATASTALPDTAPKMTARPLLYAKMPAVYVYHTHNRESWLSVTQPKGRADAMDGETNIVDVGRVFAETLKDAGVPVYHETTDIYALLKKEGLSYSASYDTSRRVALQAIAEHRDIRYLFDIHRDSMPRKTTTVTINGTTYAKIMFVIGKGNPHWAKNKALAEALAERVEAKMPGLMRPIIDHESSIWHNGEYNQTLSEHAFTVEIGGTENTPEEAMPARRRRASPWPC
ncbi:MAG: stage II sporulation protein P [Hydrogenibacillus sp.]|nr:stage II sporulation protein P [Hydrogenibacillus sp.]